MIRAHLTVDYAKVPRLKLASKHRQCHFGRVIGPREHRFAEECTAYGYSIETAGKFSVQPRFYRVGKTGMVLFSVCSDHLFSDPGSGLPIAWRAACGNDLRESLVGGHLEVRGT